VARYGLRQKAGAVVYDWPRYVRSMARRGAWVTYRNRSETLTIDPRSGGARCEWVFTSELHIANVYPATGRWLLRRATAEWPILFAERPMQSAEPRVSFIIGHRGETRFPHLLKTLDSIAAQRGVGIECIVVEQSEAPLVRGRLPDWVVYVHQPIGSNSEPYNRSRTFNEGVRHARAPLFVLHDNDFLVPADYAAELARRHDLGSEVIDLKRFMFYIKEEDVTRVLQSSTLPSLTPLHVIQNLLGGGSLAADRRAYSELGGFDESFVGWGGEDNEFWDRAMKRRVDAFATMPLVHIWHEAQPEKKAKLG